MQVISNIDRHIIQPAVERLWMWNMRYSEDPDLKGDVKVVAKGANALVVKEAAAQRRNEMMQIALTNPMAQQIMAQVTGQLTGHLGSLKNAVQALISEQAKGMQHCGELENLKTRLEFEERSDKLVSKDEVDAKVVTLARQLRERMQQIPNKVAPEIVALVVDKPDVRGVADLIDRAIHQALEELVA